MRTRSGHEYMNDITARNNAEYNKDIAINVLQDHNYVMPAWRRQLIES